MSEPNLVAAIWAPGLIRALPLKQTPYRLVAQSRHQSMSAADAANLRALATVIVAERSAYLPAD